LTHKSKDVEKKTLEKLKGQLRMDNPEKLATWGTQDTGRRQIKKTKKTTTQYANNINKHGI